MIKYLIHPLSTFGILILLFNLYIFPLFDQKFEESQQQNISKINNFDIYNLDSDRCTIPKVDINEISLEDFKQYYYDKTPVILTNSQRHIENSEFIQNSQLLNLKNKYSDKLVVLSTANKASYFKKTVKFNDYIDNYLNSTKIDQEGNSTWYMFGDNKYKDMPELFQSYKLPTLVKQIADENRGVAYSFGLSGYGAGVPMHNHGAVFAEVIHGAKRWFFFPPKYQIPDFNGDMIQLKWIKEVYPTIREIEKISKKEDLLECVAREGELLFIPKDWEHSTLNIGEKNVYISAFL